MQVYYSASSVGLPIAAVYQRTCERHLFDHLSFVLHPRKTNMTMEYRPFEDVSPIKIGDVPLSC